MRTSAMVRQIHDVVATPVPRARGAEIRVLLGADEGMPNFFTRQFTLKPGGRIPCHRHDTIEHEQVMIAGEMRLTLDGETRTVRAGECIYIPAKVAHAYENCGTTPVVFLCIIPAVADYATEWLEDAAT